jgi:hypothetical protein
VLPTHEHLADYRDHAIYRRKPGFEYTPVLLGRIASFLVRGPGGHLAIFAFMVPLLRAEQGDAPGDDALLAAAADAIRATIDRGPLPTQLEATYEYRAGCYVAVTAPRWWISTW